MRAWVLLLLFAAGCARAESADIRLLRQEAGTAQIVDLSSIRHEDGVRRVSVIGVARKAVPAVPQFPGGPSPGMARYASFAYAFDCPRERYRGEGVVIYDDAFETLATHPAISPWRPVTGERGLDKDFRLVCSPDPGRTSSAERLPAQDWREAARLVLERLQARD